eukprot:scaffold231231_cov21-Tisochrysis_lutea.AAC.2
MSAEPAFKGTHAIWKAHSADIKPASTGTQAVWLAHSADVITASSLHTTHADAKGAQQSTAALCSSQSPPVLTCACVLSCFIHLYVHA